MEEPAFSQTGRAGCAFGSLSIQPVGFEVARRPRTIHHGASHLRAAAYRIAPRLIYLLRRSSYELAPEQRRDTAFISRAVTCTFRTVTVERGRGAAPRLLRYSILVWSVAIVCWLSAGILSQAFRNAGALDLSTSNTSVSLDDTGTLTTHIQNISTIAPVYIAGIFFGLLAALWAALVLMVARGTNWARIIQTVLAVLGAIAIVIQLQLIFRGHPGPATAIPASLNIIALAALPVAGVLLYLPSTNAYFAGRAPHTPILARPRLPQPVEVARAVRLWWIGLVVEMIGAVVSLLAPDPTMQLWIRIVAVLAAWAVWITLIVFLGRGANWARVLLAIIAAYGLVNVIQNLTGHVGSVPRAVLSIVAFAVEAVATVLLYRPTANAYFSTVRAEAVRRRYRDPRPDRPVAR